MEPLYHRDNFVDNIGNDVELDYIGIEGTRFCSEISLILEPT